MKLATHNTMTYLKPKQWWCRMFPFIAKCQSVDYKKQHKLGACGYDLRIFWDKHGNLEYRHGIYRYPANNIYEVLDYARDNNIIIRILFELRCYNAKYISNIDELKAKFISFCEDLENKYPTIKFYGGYSTDSCEQLYIFKNKIDMYEFGMYSSISSLFKKNNKILGLIDDWCPWLYAKLMNKKNIEENKDKDNYYIMSIDFINLI